MLWELNAIIAGTLCLLYKLTMRNIVRWSTSSYRAVSSVSLWQTNDHRYTRFFHCTIFKVPTHNILYDRETVSNIQTE